MKQHPRPLKKNEKTCSSSKNYNQFFLQDSSTLKKRDPLLSYTRNIENAESSYPEDNLLLQSLSQRRCALNPHTFNHSNRLQKKKSSKKVKLSMGEPACLRIFTDGNKSIVENTAFTKLLKKTDEVLKAYKSREEQWQKQRIQLIQQLQKWREGKVLPYSDREQNRDRFTETPNKCLKFNSSKRKLKNTGSMLKMRFYD